MTRPHRSRSLDPSKVLWPTIYGFVLVAVTAQVLFLIGAWP